MQQDRIEKINERHEAALENLHAIGQYLIMQEDCPIQVRDAWRTINKYIRDNQINHGGQ